MPFHLGILLLPSTHKLLNTSKPLNTSFLPYCKVSALVYLAYKKCPVVFAFGISNINISTRICFISLPTALPVSSIVLTQDPSTLLSAPPQISVHYSKADPVNAMSDLETDIRERKAPDKNEKYHECSQESGI